jgi:hypothetical protein
LELGADVRVRVNPETPGWHIAKNVTPLEWAADFPEKGWVNPEAVGMIESHFLSSTL